mmetsp:Transcript_22598/g.63281  ORF Transcript_22598/g.63281 Transcript_22598/m.63281 type:complete len:363 (+) Transcript_22598:113-1201(+)
MRTYTVRVEKQGVSADSRRPCRFRSGGFLTLLGPGFVGQARAEGGLEGAGQHRVLLPPHADDGLPRDVRRLQVGPQQAPEVVDVDPALLQIADSDEPLDLLLAEDVRTHELRGADPPHALLVEAPEDLLQLALQAAEVVALQEVPRLPQLRPPAHELAVLRLRGGPDQQQVLLQRHGDGAVAEARVEFGEPLEAQALHVRIFSDSLYVFLAGDLAGVVAVELPKDVAGAPDRVHDAVLTLLRAGAAQAAVAAPLRGARPRRSGRARHRRRRGGAPPACMACRGGSWRGTGAAAARRLPGLHGARRRLYRQLRVVGAGAARTRGRRPPLGRVLPAAQRRHRRLIRRGSLPDLLCGGAAGGSLP